MPCRGIVQDGGNVGRSSGGGGSLTKRRPLEREATTVEERRAREWIQPPSSRRGVGAKRGRAVVVTRRVGPATKEPRPRDPHNGCGQSMAGCDMREARMDTANGTSHVGSPAFVQEVDLARPKPRRKAPPDDFHGFSKLTDRAEGTRRGAPHCHTISQRAPTPRTRASGARPQPPSDRRADSRFRR